MTRSQSHTLAARHGTLVTQVCLGVHGHVPTLGFHIALVGHAASGFQSHTLAGRYRTLVTQVGLCVHGHIAAFGFHIAFVGDAAGIGFHAHRGTCLHDALVEDFIGRRQFHLVGGYQALVDHALGGVQDDVVPGQTVFILQGPGCLFMEPAAANGEGSRSLQISLVIDQADAFRSRHRSVDGQVVHRTILVIANSDVLGLAAVGEENGQVLAAAAADGHIGGIAAVLHGHVLEVVEDFLVIQLGPTLQVDTGNRIQTDRGCRDGMARTLADVSAGFQGQGIRGQAAFGQIDGTGRIQRHFPGSLDLAVHSRHAVCSFPACLHRAFARQDEFVLALHVGQSQGTRILAAQVDIALLGVGAEYTGILHPQAIVCKAQAAVRGNQVHFVPVDVAAGLAVFGGHLHAGIGTQVDHADGYALESQSLGPTVVQPGLVQVQVALGPGIQAAAQIGQDVVGTAADITGTTGDGQIPGGDAAFLHLHAPVAHELHIGAGVDLPGDIQSCILHPGQIDAACPGRVAAVGVQGHLSAVQLEGDGLLLPDRQTGIVPGQISGLGLGQDLEVLQFVQIRIGDFFGCSIHADVLPGIQGDILPFDVGGGHHHHFVLGRSVEHSVLDGVKQVVPAPAVGIAAIDFAVVQDEILFFCRIILALEISLACFIIRLGRFVKSSLAFLFRHGSRFTLKSFDFGLIGFLGSLQFFTACCIHCIGGSLCLVVSQGMVAPAFRCQLCALDVQGIETFLFGSRRCSRPAVISIGITHKAHFLPESHLVGAARKSPVTHSVFKTAVGGQAYITTIGNDVTDPHIAIVIGKSDIPFRLGIDAGRQGIAVERVRRCRHIRRDGPPFADEVDAVAHEYCALSRLQIAVGPQVEIAVLDAGFLDIEIAIARKQAYAALVAFQADIGSVTQCTVIQGNILQSAGRQAVRVDDCPILALDAAFLAGKRHRPTIAGGSDAAGQVNILAACNGDGVIRSLQEADADGLVRLDGIRTAGRTRCRLCPAIGNLPGEMRPVIILLRLDDFTVRLRPTVFSRGNLILRRLSARRDEGTLPQQRAGWKVRSRRFQLACRGIDTLEELIGRTVLDQRPDGEILGVRFLLDGFITRGTARPLHGLGSRLIHHTAGVIRIGGTRALTIRRRRFSRNHTVIVPVFRQGILVGIFDADQAVRLLIADGANAEVAADLRRVNRDGRRAVHGHQAPRTRRAGQCAGDVDLAAARIDAFRQEFLRRRIVVDLDLILPDTAVCIVIRTAAIDQIPFIAKDLVVLQRYLVLLPLLIQQGDAACIRIHTCRKRCLISVVAALDKTVQDYVLAVEIDILTGLDTSTRVLLRRMLSRQYCIQFIIRKAQVRYCSIDFNRTRLRFCSGTNIFELFICVNQISRLTVSFIVILVIGPQSTK